MVLQDTSHRTVNLPNVRAITLAGTPGRTERLTEHLRDRGIEWKAFNGVDAAKWGLTTSNTYEIDHPGSNYIIPQKHVGLHLSHYILWTIQHETCTQEMTILEDDAMFTEDWKTQYAAARDSLPEDWDILLIGSAHSDYRPKRHIKGTIWEVLWPITTHAYIVNFKALPVLLKTQQHSGSPIDLSLNFRTYPLLNVYTPLPRLAEQHNTPLEP